MQQIIARLTTHANTDSQDNLLCESHKGMMFLDMLHKLQQYLTTMRLLQAKYYLQYGDMTASETYKRVGFSEASYFSRLFRKQFGISPGQCL